MKRSNILEIVRYFNKVSRPEVKVASAIAKSGGSCKTCAYYKKVKLSANAVYVTPYCDVKKKEVKPYNICEKWKGG